MKPTEVTGTEVRDVSLEHGCILCGSTLELRVGPAGAYTVCTPCRWISHPRMTREGEKLHVVYPAAGRA